MALLSMELLWMYSSFRTPCNIGGKSVKQVTVATRAFDLLYMYRYYNAPDDH